LENTTYTGTKERIIKASVKLFSEKGFDATRVSEIADTANVNKVLIY
jgi:AcrR family transcriptional regulator